MVTCAVPPLPVGVGLLLLVTRPLGTAGISIDSIFPNSGSFAGGTHLTIHGTGFQMPIDANLWDQQQVRTAVLRHVFSPELPPPALLTLRERVRRYLSAL